MRRSSNGTLISCLLWWLAYGPGRFQMLPATEPTISLLERLGNLLLAHLPVASSLCYQAEILDVVQHAVRHCPAVIEVFCGAPWGVSAVARTTAACLRAARLEQLAAVVGTFPACMPPAPTGNVGTAKDAASNAFTLLSDADDYLEEDDLGQVIRPPRYVAAARRLREVIGDPGSWDDELADHVADLADELDQAPFQPLLAPQAPNIWLEAAQAIVATDVHLPELLLHAAQDQVALAEAAAAAERAQQAQQVQQAQQGHLDLVSLLMEASQRPAAAAAGLTANLVDRFWAVMATLSLKEQAAREVPLRLMLGHGQLSVAAEMMRKQVELAPADAAHGLVARDSATSIPAPETLCHFVSCLLLRSMARAAFISGTARPAVGFLQRYASLVASPWYPQQLLVPVLQVLQMAVVDEDLDGRGRVLAAVSAAMGAVVSLPLEAPADHHTPALCAALEVISCCARTGSPPQGSHRLSQFLEARCLPAVMRCVRRGSHLMEQNSPGSPGFNSGWKLADVALSTATALVFPGSWRSSGALVELVIARQPPPPLLREAALQLAVGIPPGELLRVAELGEVPPPPPPLEQRQEQPGPQAEPTASASGEQAQQEPAGVQHQVVGADAAGGAVTTLEQLIALLFGIALAPDHTGAGQDAPRQGQGEMASEALHLLAAIALNFPAAQDALLRQPGDVASLAARLEGPMEQAAVEVRASWCTTILGSLALRPGAGQLAGGGAVDAVAGGLQLALEQERAAPPFGPAPYANLRGCCIMAAASFVLRADRQLCAQLTADGGRMAGLRRACASSVYPRVREVVGALLDAAEMVAAGACWAQVVAQHGELLLVAANDVAESMQRELGFPAMVPQVLQLCAARPDCQGVLSCMERATGHLALLVPEEQASEGLEGPGGQLVAQANAEFLRSSQALEGLVGCVQLLARTLEQARLSWGAVSGREARKLLPTVFVLLQVLAVLRNAAGVAQLRAPLQSQLGGAAALDQVVAAVQMFDGTTMHAEARRCTDLAQQVASRLAADL